MAARASSRRRTGGRLSRLCFCIGGKERAPLFIARRSCELERGVMRPLVGHAESGGLLITRVFFRLYSRRRQAFFTRLFHLNKTGRVGLRASGTFTFLIRY